MLVVPCFTALFCSPIQVCGLGICHPVIQEKWHSSNPRPCHHRMWHHMCIIVYSAYTTSFAYTPARIMTQSLLFNVPEVWNWMTRNQWVAFNSWAVDAKDFLWKYSMLWSYTGSCLLRFLDEVQSHSNENKMSVQNLATVFGPNILRPRAEDPVAMMEGWW